jgi:hypothetical protein
MDFCPRCDGGAIPSPNCPTCGGSGFVTDSQPEAPSTTLPSPFRSTTELTRQTREQEKRRKVKVLKVKMTPEERRRAEHEALAAKCEAMRRRKAAEAQRRLEARRKAPLTYRSTPEGAVVESTYRKKKESSDILSQAPTSRKIPMSKWSTPKPSQRRREALEERLAGELEDRSAAPPKPRESREEQSAKQVRNTTLADQLAPLKDSLVVSSEPATTRRPVGKQATTDAEAARQPATPKDETDYLKSEKSVSLARQRRKRKRLAAEKAKKSKSFVPVRDGKLEDGAAVPTTCRSESRLVKVQTDRQGRVSWGAAGHSDDLTQGDHQEDRRGTAAIFEPRYREEDGGRHMGHSFRDLDGSYGSLPLYDNYDELDE